MNHSRIWRLLHSRWHCDNNSMGVQQVATNSDDRDFCTQEDHCLPNSRHSMELNDMERGPRRIFKHLHNRKGPPGRLDLPRLSLLGKPINYRPPRHRDPRYRKAQLAVHNVLDRPR
ncbi:hypothetical protein X975_17147, partial [Stegodyphus mimosarum]